jgi:hypothetical protein
MRARENEDIRGDEGKCNSVERTEGARSYVRLRETKHAQHDLMTVLSAFNALYFACLPILYSPVNPFLFPADPLSSPEAGHTLEVAR